MVVCSQFNTDLKQFSTYTLGFLLIIDLLMVILDYSGILLEQNFCGFLFNKFFLQWILVTVNFDNSGFVYSCILYREFF